MAENDEEGGIGLPPAGFAAYTVHVQQCIGEETAHGTGDGGTAH